LLKNREKDLNVLTKCIDYKNKWETGCGKPETERGLGWLK